MNQRSATVSTLIAVLQERGVEYELDGVVCIKDVLTKADKEVVQSTLFAMFRGGQIDMSADAKEKYSDDKKMTEYVRGLVSNWINKAPEFNSGNKHEFKNPGSRKGAGDSQIREMKKLLGATNDETTKEVIKQHIAKRQEEIKPTAVAIDSSKLPESLRHLVK
jgi:hypothetical protein